MIARRMFSPMTLWIPTSSPLTAAFAMLAKAGRGAFRLAILLLGMAGCLIALNRATASLHGIPTGLQQDTRVPHISSVVDRSTIQIADPFELTITAIAPNGARVLFPSAPETIGPFKVNSHADRFDIPVDDHRSWTRRYQLETLKTGPLQIPATTIQVDGQPLVTVPISIEVPSLLTDQSDPLAFRELKDIVDIPRPPLGNQRWIVGVGIGTVVLATIAIVVLLRRRNNHDSPEHWICSQLKELKASEAFERGDQIFVLPAIADVLRQYIQRRFAIAAPQQTTTEFLRHVQSDSRLSAQQQQELGKFLSEVDQIKFASYLPAQNRMNAALDQAQAFVTETTFLPRDRGQLPAVATRELPTLRRQN